jgi:uncharacterized membrane protein
MSMNETNPAPGPAALPPLRSRWWTVVLGLSLMANLLIGGIFLGHGVRGTDGFGRHDGRGPDGRGATAQLMPRGFFAQLPDQRRRDLMMVLRQHRPDFVNLRQQTSDTALRLADLIAADPYDAAAVTALVQDYVRQNSALQDRGALALTDVLARLTPSERQLLAAELRKPRGPWRN